MFFDIDIDIDTGKRLWQNKLPAADFAARTNTNLALTEGVVAVAWGQGSAAYDMGSGRRLWNTTTTSQCHDMGYAGGRALLALVNCGDPRQPSYRVEKLDSRTGKDRWTYRLASGVQAVYLPSSDPPVLAVAAGDSTVTDLITLDGENGRRMATISMSGYDAQCGRIGLGPPYFGVLAECDLLVVGPYLIFLTSQENIANGQPVDWIVAFAPRTGHSVAKFEGRELQKVVPVRASGENLILYRAEGFANPAAVVSWNPRTDKETPYLLFEVPGTGDWQPSNPGETRIVCEQGHVFFSRRTLRADDDSPKDPVPSLFGIGSAGLKH
ncbi:PQQ-binding-like beta-propeller repeat protein [Streptomyces sp. NPDC047028]|uniref:outer membrane protein assembly factor BamB family protein n=1 Tax=Streptomyces sp. NPDC047028 TaxID=3155793 RepID=UPI0033E0E9BD